MRKRRGYKREETFPLVRDYKLFAIACEGGRREPEYFKTFEYISSKIKVDIIEERIDGKPQTKSSPTWILDRAINYIDKEGLIDEDQLYFVIDVDKWTSEQLKMINDYCNQHSNWHLVLSNPCFEVWLYFHKEKSIEKSTSSTANDFKNEIAGFEKGGYHPYKFIPNLQDAINNARAADKGKKHYMPKSKQTKVYLLGEAILHEVGINDFNNFIEKKLPQLIEAEKLKAKKSKSTKR